MYKDHVFCNYCEEESFVEVGAEECPKCKMNGYLAWADEKEGEE